MALDHVFRAIDDQVALNALVAAKRATQDRLMVDMAKQGVCGQPAHSRREWANSAQTIADFRPDRAVAEPLVDLAYVLREASDDEGSQRLCARGLGGAWHAEHPFRRERPGDPWDVLLPHLDDVSAVAALDRARGLPRLPPTALMRRAVEVETGGGSGRGTEFVASAPYSRSLALALLGRADRDMRQLALVWNHTYSGRVDLKIRQASRALTLAREWVDSDALWFSGALDKEAGHVIDWSTVGSDFNDVVQEASVRLADVGHGGGTAVSVLGEAQQAARSVVAALTYVNYFNITTQQLRDVERAERQERADLESTRDDAEKTAGGVEAYASLIAMRESRCEDAVSRVRELRAKFPDFYPEYAE